MHIHDWHLDWGLSGNVNLGRGSLLELFGDFFERLIQVAANDTRLSAALNQVFEDTDVEVFSKPDYVKL